MKYFVKLIIPVFCLLVTVNAAQAQSCSTTDQTALKSCVDLGLAICRDGSACNDYEPVLSIQDVRDLAITNCCGKSNKTARRLCLVKESKKYLPEVASGSQRTFFRAARAAVKDVQNNVCKNSTYDIDTDSALF